MRIAALLIALTACSSSPRDVVPCDPAWATVLRPPAPQTCQRACQAPPKTPMTVGTACDVVYTDANGQTQSQAIDCSASPGVDFDGHAGCCVDLGPGHSPDLLWADCGP